MELSISGQGPRTIVRVFIDKPGGVTLEDCEQAHRSLNPALDVADPFPHAYMVEVSSPGLDRPLRRPEDFRRVQGKRISLKLKEPHRGQWRVTGEIVGVEEHAVTLALEEKKIMEMVRFEFGRIATARLDVGFWSPVTEYRKSAEADDEVDSMNRELISVIDEIGRQKGIDKARVIGAIESALQTAAKKRFGQAENIEVEIDPKTGEISVVSKKIIVDTVTNPKAEISLKEAREFDDGAEVGDEIGSVIEMDELGRIAAQTAKQVIFQKVREAEWEAVQKEYSTRQGDLVNGIILGMERRNYLVDLGKTEADFPHSGTDTPGKPTAEATA